MENVNSQSLGRIGELAVEMELLKRGWKAGNFNATTGNAAAYDLFAVKDGKKVLIRVKSFKGKKSRSGEGVQYSAKKDGSVFLERDNDDGSDFVIIVRIAPEEPEEFYIIPTAVVDETIQKTHSKWLSGTKKDGSARKDSSLRALRFSARKSNGKTVKGYDDIWAHYRDAWASLEA